MTVLQLTHEQADKLSAFASLVAASPHNLVSKRARAELMTRHVPEAVRLAAVLPDPPARLLDVGSGGGFPGMVIAIARPDLEVHLLEATGKKVTFLRDAATSLEIDVVVHHGRAEELCRGALGGAFDLVTARAVASLRDLLPLTLPFLAEGGALYAVKGERWDEELRDASGALRRQGAVVLATPEDVTIPAVDGCEGPSPRVVMLGRA